MEDHAATILLGSDGTVDGDKTKKIASGMNGGPPLANAVRFGRSVASMGDLDGDGVNDLAVGAEFEDVGGLRRGTVHILLMNTNGTVSCQDIAHNRNGGPPLCKAAALGLPWRM